MRDIGGCIPGANGSLKQESAGIRGKAELGEHVPARTS
jgi:hypothetical protein